MTSQLFTASTSRGQKWSSRMAAPLHSDLNRVNPVEAWKPWQPQKSEWSRKGAAHLYRRAAFGAKPADIDRAIAEGLPKTLRGLIAGTAEAGSLLEMYADIGRNCKDAGQLRGWWLSLMMDGGHPLREKLTLFWHNHFATSIAKVRQISLLLEQNIALRKHALGKVRPFFDAMAKNPAMLIWLDSNQNVKKAPNENFARELWNCSRSAWATTPKRTSASLRGPSPGGTPIPLIPSSRSSSIRMNTMTDRRPY